MQRDGSTIRFSAAECFAGSLDPEIAVGDVPRTLQWLDDQSQSFLAGGSWMQGEAELTGIDQYAEHGDELVRMSQEVAGIACRLSAMVVDYGAARPC